MRLIDADVFKTEYENLITWVSHRAEKERLRDFINDIQSQPTVDAEPVKHGHWVKNDNGTYSCSECHSWIPSEQHHYARYCLFCGAKMNEEEENEKS